MNVSEMFPVLMMFKDTLPQLPAVAPLVETPWAETLYSDGRIFWSYMMTMSSSQYPMSVPLASDVNSNLNCELLWNKSWATGTRGEFAPLLFTLNVCQFAESVKSWSMVPVNEPISLHPPRAVRPYMVNLSLLAALPV